MPAPKGHARYGGRQKGTPNKVTKDLIDIVHECLGMSLPEKIFELFPGLQKSQKAQVLMQMMDYIYPKRKAIDVTTKGEAIAPNTNLSSMTDEQLHEEYKRAIGKQRK